MLERLLPEHSACTNGSLIKHWYLFIFFCDFIIDADSCGSVHGIPSVLSIDMGILIYSILADVAATAFYEPANVIDFVAQLLNGLDPRQPMKDHERVKVLIFCMCGSLGSNCFCCFNFSLVN